MDAAHGPSRHFDAAQQPRRFRSKADINFGASSYRVYEYTAWLSWRDHTPYVGDSDALLDGIEEFLTGIRPVPSRIELWQQFFSPMSSILRSRQHRKWGELLQQLQHHVLVRRSWRDSVAGRRTRRGIVSRSLFDGPGRAHPLWDEHLAAGTLVGHRHRVETLFPQFIERGCSRR
jgi:hypothetical protein